MSAGFRWGLIAACVLVSDAASAQRQRADALLEMIKSEDASSTILALTYIDGVRDAHEPFSQVIGGKQYCIPDGVTNGQILAVVKKEIEAHPETWSLPAALQVIAAFTASWPCIDE